MAPAAPRRRAPGRLGAAAHADFGASDSYSDHGAHEATAERAGSKQARAGRLADSAARRARAEQRHDDAWED